MTATSQSIFSDIAACHQFSITKRFYMPVTIISLSCRRVQCDNVTDFLHLLQMRHLDHFHGRLIVASVTAKCNAPACNYKYQEYRKQHIKHAHVTKPRQRDWITAPSGVLLSVPLHAGLQSPNLKTTLRYSINKNVLSIFKYLYRKEVLPIVTDFLALQNSILQTQKHDW